MCITAIVASAVGGLAAASQKAKVATESTKRAYTAEEQNLRLIQKENTRLQNESNDLYDSEVSDRVRLANRELGALTVLMGESGVSTSSIASLSLDSEYTAGMDITRINTSRDNQIESLQASKRAGQQGYLNNTTLAYNQGAAAVANANASAIGAVTGGVSNYGGHVARQRSHKLRLNGYTEY